MMVNRNDVMDEQIFDINTNRRSFNGGKIIIKELIKSLNRNVFLKSYKYIYACNNSDKLKRIFENLINNAKFFTQHLHKT